MTENRRIFWNIIATYGRSLFTLVCGVFTGRWVLMALGEVDYGLFGVVGGLMVFISFFNSVLAGAIGRFYAVSVGKAKITSSLQEGVEECRKWFNTALSIHTFVPLILIIIGYPIGEWAVRNWLTIPPDRVEACVLVFRFACLSCFMGMINVPFAAMYGAKQYIAELTIYSFVTTTLNVCFLYYMVSTPGAWLTKYALWTCLLSIVPQLIICVRACCIFPECHLNLRYWYNWERLKQVGQFAGWQMLGCFCGLLRTTGMTMLVNKMFGPNVNAAQAIANTVNGHASSLAGAMQTAFSPAITTAFGANDQAKMIRMAFRSCKFSVLLALIFMLPLALELPEVMRIWLKNPPQYAVGLCWCMLLYYIVDVITQGHMVVVNASGRIAGYHIVLSLISVVTLPVAYLCVKLGFGVYLSIGGVLVFMIMLNSIGRIVFARLVVGMGIRYWVFKVFIPLVLLILISGGTGFLMRFLLEPSFLRICLATLTTEIVFLPLAWFVVLDAHERDFMFSKLSAKFPILKRFAN